MTQLSAATAFVTYLVDQYFWNYVLTLALIVLSIFMINEHAARISASEFLNAKINDAYKRLSAEPNDDAGRQKLKTSIDTAQHFKTIVDAIIVSGYPPKRPPTLVSHEVETIDKRVAEMVQSLLDHDEPIGTLLSGSNNMLIAFITIACCGIGASFSSIRAKSATPLSSTFMGFIAGFVVFLVLKGGKTIFIVNSSEVTHLVNPYNSALAALIVGMFTERAYLILERVVGELARRIEEVAHGGTGPNKGKRPSPTPGTSPTKSTPDALD